MLLRGEGHGKRNDFLLLLLEGTLQQRMTCLAEVHLAFFRYYRHACDEIQGYLGLRHDEVDLSQISRSVEKVRYIRTEEFSELEEDAHDLPLLGEFQFLYLVVQFHDLCRLDERCLSSRRFVIYETGYLLLVCRAYRNEHLAVAYRNSCITVHDAFLLCLLQDCADSS